MADNLEDDTGVIDDYEDAPDEQGPEEGLPVEKGRSGPAQPSGHLESDTVEPEEGGPPPEPVQSQGKEFNALAAKHRMLERDNQILSRRFEQVLEAIRASNQQPLAQEPELPDPDENLGDHILKRFDRLDQKVDEDRKAQLELANRASINQEYQAAYNGMISYRATNPAVYDEAMRHFSEVVWEEVRDELPAMTDQEIGKLLQEQAVARQLKWHREGKNPGVELYKMAVRRGFRPSEQPPVASAGDPRQAIKQDREREKAGRTISAVSGSAARGNLKIATILSQDEDEWEKTVKGLPLSKLLAGKARK